MVFLLRHVEGIATLPREVADATDKSLTTVKRYQKRAKEQPAKIFHDDPTTIRSRFDFDIGCVNRTAGNRAKWLYETSTSRTQGKVFDKAGI